MAIVGSWGRFRMMLDGEYWTAFNSDTFKCAIKERDVGFDNANRYIISFHNKAMVLARNFYLTCFQIFYRVICAMVTMMHFAC